MSDVEFIGLVRAIVAVVVIPFCLRARLYWLAGAWCGFMIVGIELVAGASLVWINAIAAPAYGLLAAHTLWVTQHRRPKRGEPSSTG